MKRRATVELYEEIRREYRRGCGTVKGVADKLCVHRRTVRQALESAVPTPAKERRRNRPLLEPVTGFVDEILRTDRQAPRKQRHTAHRIWVRLQQELGSTVAESTVREYVRERKQELGLERRETFVPQCYQPGQEAQVDWYEATVDFCRNVSDGGVSDAGISGDFVGSGSWRRAAQEGEVDRQKVQVFALRAMYSGAAFHLAFPHATQQAFLEAHEAAFAYFGGVFVTLRYDNLSSAVKKILRGHQREETQRFVAFRSHWGFEAQFCNPAQGHEKGGVEGEVGYFRRNHLVPVPRVANWWELNGLLDSACRADAERIIGSRSCRVGQLLDEERPHLLPLAAECFDLQEVLWVLVDRHGCVRVKTNSYSTPLRCGSRVKVVVAAVRVEIWQENRCVAVHGRCYERHRQILELEHYLGVLLRKPGAMPGALPLAQARRQGRWPACFDQLWQRLQERHGHQDGTRLLVELLLESRSLEKLRPMVEQALRSGTADVAAIRLLMRSPAMASPPPHTLLQMEVNGEPLELTMAQQLHYERAVPDVSCYDRLRTVHQQSVHQESVHQDSVRQEVDSL